MFDLEFTAEEQQQGLQELCRDHFPEMLARLNEPDSTEPPVDVSQLTPEDVPADVDNPDCKLSIEDYRRIVGGKRTKK